MKYPNDLTHLNFSTMHLFLGKCMHPVDQRPSIYHVSKGLGGWVQKMASFADFQYCIYADFTPIVGGWVRKFQNHADVIYEWSLRVLRVFSVQSIQLQNISNFFTMAIYELCLECLAINKSQHFMDHFFYEALWIFSITFSNNFSVKSL